MWLAALAAGIVWLAALAAGPLATAHAAHKRSPCSGPNAAHVPCRFSTPSGNVRCEWRPAHDTVVCELLASARAYRLRATGHAVRVSVHLAHRGQSLPTDQQLVFPNALSCHDTRTTMTCNQDFLTGEFTLAPGHSHSS